MTGGEWEGGCGGAVVGGWVAVVKSEWLTVVEWRMGGCGGELSCFDEQ